MTAHSLHRRREVDQRLRKLQKLIKLYLIQIYIQRSIREGVWDLREDIDLLVH